MFGKIGVGELVIVLVIVLVIFGPSKLPALAKSIGQAIREFKKGTKEVTDKFQEFVDEPVIENEQDRPVRTTKATVEQTTSSAEEKIK